jgi:hypothetical protein
MPLNPNGMNPVVIIELGGEDSGSCDIYFQNKRIVRFDNNKSLHKIELDPMILLGSAQANVADLIGSEIGWVVIFTNLVGPKIEFSFTLDIRQSDISIITPVDINDGSDNVVNAGMSLIFNGKVVLK